MILSMKTVQWLVVPGLFILCQGGILWAQSLLEPGNFVLDTQFNPSISRGGSTWDSEMMESGDLFYDEGIYYWYYHAEGPGYNDSYAIGLATSASPTGPWERRAAPVVPATESYETEYSACAYVFKVDETYYMYYTANTLEDEMSLCFATATNPVGPWTKHDPLATLVHYVGGVVEVDGTWYLFYSRPSEIQDDYGRMYVATADHPEGPWTFHPEPVLSEGPKGSWDEGGFSEAEVSYYNGSFHIFYGGGDLRRKRIMVKESIGYAYSTDGYHFTKYSENPVVPRALIKDAGALAEVHFLIQYPKIYLVYTYRHDNPRFEEDLGMTVITISDEPK